MSEQAHPLGACSHGNGSDSEQLVFVFFGNVATAGMLTGTGEVGYAEALPGRSVQKECFSFDFLLSVVAYTPSYLGIQHHCF